MFEGEGVSPFDDAAGCEIVDGCGEGNAGLVAGRTRFAVGGGGGGYLDFGP